MVVHLLPLPTKLETLQLVPSATPMARQQNRLREIAPGEAPTGGGGISRVSKRFVGLRSSVDI
jgi:hypothetical protein